MDSNEELSSDVQSLQAKIKELEAQLKKENFRADAYDEMINVAEAKFNIPIRKKSWHQTVNNLHAKDPPKSENVKRQFCIRDDAKLPLLHLLMFKYYNWEN